MTLHLDHNSVYFLLILMICIRIPCRAGSVLFDNKNAGESLITQESSPGAEPVRGNPWVLPSLFPKAEFSPDIGHALKEQAQTRRWLREWQARTIAKVTGESPFFSNDRDKGKPFDKSLVAEKVDNEATMDKAIIALEGNQFKAEEYGFPGNVPAIPQPLTIDEIEAVEQSNGNNLAELFHANLDSKDMDSASRINEQLVRSLGYRVRSQNQRQVSESTSKPSDSNTTVSGQFIKEARKATPDKPHRFYYKPDGLNQQEDAQEGYYLASAQSGSNDLIIIMHYPASEKPGDRQGQPDSSAPQTSKSGATPFVTAPDTTPTGKEDSQSGFYGFLKLSKKILVLSPYRKDTLSFVVISPRFMATEQSEEETIANSKLFLQAPFSSSDSSSDSQNKELYSPSDIAELGEIIGKFFEITEFCIFTPLDGGRINKTLLVSCPNTPSRILQSKNTSLFNIETLEHNLSKFPRLLKEKLNEVSGSGFQSPAMIHTLDKKVFTRVGDTYWCMMEYIESSPPAKLLTDYTEDEKRQLVISSARLLGTWHSVASGLDITLQDSIPGYHELTHYLEIFINVLRKNEYTSGILKDYRPEEAGLLPSTTDVSTTVPHLAELEMVIRVILGDLNAIRPLWDLVNQENSPIPRRIVHGDPKNKNMLFSKDDRSQAIALIDLETVKMQPQIFDFSEMARIITNTVDEDSKNHEDAEINIDLYKLQLETYLYFASHLKAEELKYLLFSVFHSTYEQLIRFLYSYLDHGSYYNPHSEWNAEKDFGLVMVQYYLYQSLKNNVQALKDVTEQAITKVLKRMDIEVLTPEF